MLRADPRPWLRRSAWRARLWWGRGSTRRRFRRRLLVFSLPVVLVLVAVIVKIAGVLVVGNSVVSDFGRHDIDALRDDLDSLSTFNLIEPHKLPFAQGDLAVLEGRLDDAERYFVDALSRTPADASCPTRINLELVRETQADLAARGGDKAKAEERYNGALEAVTDAPANCFAGNSDPNAERKHIRQDAEPRLKAKIASLHRPPAPPSPPPPTVSATPPSPSLSPTQLPGAPPPPTGAPPTEAPTPPPGAGDGERPVFGPDGGGGNDTGSGALNDVDPDRIPISGADANAPGHKLDPKGGDPLDKLQDALGNADAKGGSRE
jgi:hypothetical protein